MFLDTPQMVAVQFRPSGVGWSGGYQSENNATLWSNLQDCKISSRAEIPKLDRVWQLLTGAVSVNSFLLSGIILANNIIDMDCPSYLHFQEHVNNS